MPFAYEIDHPRQRIVTRVEGDIHLPEIEAHIAALHAAAAGAFDELVDARLATAAFSAADVRRLVILLQSLAESISLGRAAVIVADDVSFGMLRMLSILAGEVIRVQVFRAMHPAREWLGWDN